MPISTVTSQLRWMKVSLAAGFTAWSDSFNVSTNSVTQGNG
jgi:hypothetical protein